MATQKIVDSDVQHLWDDWFTTRTVEARNVLVATYWDIVPQISNRLKLRGDLKDEYESHGNLGLIKAVETWDPDAGTQFRSYAWSKVHWAMKDGAKSWDKVSRNIRAQINQLEHALETLTQQLGHEPSSDELAAYLKWTVGEVDETRIAAVNHATSEHSNGVTGETETGPIDASTINPAASGVNVESEIIVDEIRAKLADALSQLRGVEHVVLYLHYIEDMTTGEIAEVLGVSTPTASKVRRKAIETVAAHYLS